MSNFLNQYTTQLADYARLSQGAGARRDYVQGGGGNTSAKLDDHLMAVKASGFCLGDVRPIHAFAVMDYAAIRAFYRGHEATDFADAEKAGSDEAKANMVAFRKPILPSTSNSATPSTAQLVVISGR